ncbi:MAG: ABC transporter permease/substrate-binding protein [Saprospiraceae bacterium]|nr:ABC transporter permease/substrate-binding protein [Saprospiraceae bacterium]
MNSMQSFFDFMYDNRGKLLEQSLEHIGLTFFSLFLAVLIAIPAGILASRREKLAPGLLGIAGIMQTIPSIALLGFLLPILGIGIRPAIAALFLYALLPILRNTYTGIGEVDASVREAARGLGMTDWQILRKVELPLALPVIFAGIRTATVINVGVATLAAYIGAGGLGEFIFGGIALNNSQMILAGAVPAAMLAIFFDQTLAILQRFRLENLRKYTGIFLFAIPLLSMAHYLPNWYRAGLKAGFPPEFMGRKDGYDKLVETYDLKFNTVILSSALMYEAVREEEVNFISGYSTDGRIEAYDLRILEDDRHAFPPYFCTPIVNAEIASEYPEVVEALHQIAGKIDDSTMTRLNYEVDFEKRSPRQVAETFLKEAGLYRADRQEGGHRLVIGSKIFTEQYILAELFSILINGYTDLDVELKSGLGGTKICFEALRQGEIDLYPEYTGTGFLVLLTPPQDTIRSIISQPRAVYDYVSRAFESDYGIRWLEPLGFNNTYALMTREAFAKDRDLKKVSDVTKMRSK